MSKSRANLLYAIVGGFVVLFALSNSLLVGFNHPLDGYFFWGEIILGLLMVVYGIYKSVKLRGK